MERLKKIVGERVECNPLRANHVHHVEWIDRAGQSGSAWVETKRQLNQILELLQAMGAPTVHVELHHVPREKGALVSWLQQNAVRPKPVRTMRLDRIQDE